MRKMIIWRKSRQYGKRKGQPDVFSVLKNRLSQPLKFEFYTLKRFKVRLSLFVAVDKKYRQCSF
jgi:hypothetical protein